MEPLFKLSENQTTVRTELLAGVTTFLTMAYIIFVSPLCFLGKCSARKRALSLAPSRRRHVFQQLLPRRLWLFTRATRSLIRLWMGENFFFVFRRFRPRLQQASPIDGRSRSAWCSRIQRSRARDQLADLPARDCARGVFRRCAKANGLAQIQASPGSGPSESEGAVAVLTASPRNAGIRQPSASQK